MKKPASDSLVAVTLRITALALAGTVVLPKVWPAMARLVFSPLPPAPSVPPFRVSSKRTGVTAVYTLPIKVKWSAPLTALVPAGVVTVTSTVPRPGGLVAAIWVPLVTENEAAAAEPNLTATAPVKSEPVIVTEVPPAGGPWFGATELTTGGFA